MLDDGQVLLFAWGPEQATAFEREVIDRRGLSVVAVDEVAADPNATAAEALDLLEARCDRLLVHFDVDVIDFTDVPLSEHWGRNQGLAYEAAMQALNVLLTSPRLAALTITELNPDHIEQGAGSIKRLATSLAASLAGSLR